MSVWIGGQIIGYLSRDDAKAYSAVLARIADQQGACGVCRANIVGGWDRGGRDVGHFGARLALARPRQLEGEDAFPVFDLATAPPLAPDDSERRMGDSKEAGATLKGCGCVAIGALVLVAIIALLWAGC